MIISRTPLRVSFFGGGSDYPSYYLEHSGAVITTSINKYCYVALHNGKIFSFYDLPTKAGLGTSSAFTVGFLRVCTDFDQRELAKLATIWEQDKLGGNIGAQDQWICAMGGFRLLRFSEAGVRDFSFTDMDWLNPYLMLFNTHQYRMAGKVVANQLKEMKHHTRVYERMMAIVDSGKIALENKSYEQFGFLLDESWNLKKQLSKFISNPIIDDIYSKAKDTGAIGGKLLGAGGGGFMLFLSSLDKQEAIKQVLVNCEYVPFKFENSGAQIIFKDEV